MNEVRRHLRRAAFLARYEWFRSPPYVMSYKGLDLEYGRGDMLSFQYSVTGRYEPHVISYVQSSLLPGATVVDVGANVGFFSLAVLALVPESTVHMFEPSPLPRSHLARSIARNGLESRGKLNHHALYSEPGEMEFFIHAGEHSAFDGFRDTHYSMVKKPSCIKVPVTTLDVYVTHIGMERLDLLKIDVEGAEFFVLQGAEHTLSKLRPRVLFEIGQQNLDPYGLSPERMYGFFEDHGYHVQDLLGHELTTTEFTSRSKIDHEFLAVPQTSH